MSDTISAVITAEDSIKAKIKDSNSVYAKLNIPKEITRDVTAEEIIEALGYVPADEEDVPVVYDWAKEENKPTYTASEVGALPDTTVIPPDLSDEVSQLNTDIMLLKGEKADKLDVLNSKNVMNCGNLVDTTSIGVTFTPVYEDGMLKYINVNGTAIATAYYNLDYSGSTYTSSKYKFDPNTSYIATIDIDGNVNAVNGIELNVGAFDTSNSNKSYVNVGTSTKFTTNSANIYSRSYLKVNNGTTFDNVKVYPMIRLATEPSGYVPYNAGYNLEGKKASNEVVTDVWNSSTTYTVGSYVIYNNALWKCMTQNTGVIPVEGSNWHKTSVASEINSLMPTVFSYPSYSNDNYEITTSSKYVIMGKMCVCTFNVKCISESSSYIPVMEGMPSSLVDTQVALNVLNSSFKKSIRVRMNGSTMYLIGGVADFSYIGQMIYFIK